VILATPGDHQVVFPRSIGAYVYYAQGTYGGAVHAFGKPSSTRAVSAVSCQVNWADQGLRLYFRSPERPCAAGSLRTSQYMAATILSRRWSVDRGVRVGDSFRKLKRLYPLIEQSTYDKSRWRLRRVMVVIPKTHARAFAGLDAVMRYGRVLRFEMAYQYGRG
jgi:hypothetical protein